MGDLAGPRGRGEPDRMFAELAFVDWLALVVAAVLLAGAAAALVIVSFAARHRHRLAKPARTTPRELRAGPQRSISRATSSMADVIDLRTTRRSSGVTRAARADRLRRRKPIPDVAPPSEVARLSDVDSETVTTNATSESNVLAIGVPKHGGRRRESGFSPRQPGFFDDPIGRHEQRYWDGVRWTEYVKEDGVRFIDPL